jgi:biotin carboxylase
MGRVLLVDTAFSALPIYRALLDQGYEVWCIGNRISDPIAKLANERWIELDYSNREAVASVAEQRAFDAIIPGCTDVSYSTCVDIPSFRNHDGRFVYDSLNQKHAFRDLCAELGLPAPIRFTRDQFPIQGRFIVKPVDSFSGRGITQIDGQDLVGIDNALYRAKNESPSQSALIESFAGGQLYSYSCFLESRRVVDRFIVKESSSVNSYAVDTSFVDFDPPTTIDELLKSSAEALASRLKLSDGLLHIQYIVDGDQPYLIEATRRCPGDLYSLLIQYSTGYAYAAKFAAYFTGRRLNTASVKRRYVIRHTVASLWDGVNQGLEFIRPLRTCAFFPLQAVGEPVLAGQKSRLGVLYLVADTVEEREVLFRRLLNRDVYARV